MINAISSALSGLNTATQKINVAANNIARTGIPSTEESSGSDTVRDIVDLKIAETAFKANIATLETAQELSEELGRIFDQEV